MKDIDPLSPQTYSVTEVTDRAIETLEGVHPDMSRVLDELQMSKLGRSIFMGSDTLVGYALPVNEEQTSHVVIFEGGTRHWVRARPGAEQTYLNNLEQSSDPFSVTYAGNRRSIERYILDEYLPHDKNAIISDDSEAGREMIEEATQVAFRTAEGLRTSQQDRRLRTAAHLRSILAARRASALQE